MIKIILQLLIILPILGAFIITVWIIFLWAISALIEIIKDIIDDYK